MVPELLPVPPVKGGAVEHWVDEVTRRMVPSPGRLAVVSRPAGVAGHEGIEYIGIPWTPAERFFHNIKERLTWRNPFRYLAKIQNVYSYGRRVAGVVRDFDLIYLHNEPNILLFLCKRQGQKIILHMHNDHLSMRLFRPFYRCALSRADRVICVSDYIRRQAIQHFPEYADRFKVVFNATDPQIFRPYGEEALRQLEGVVRIEADKKYLLYVGRLAAVKGVHVLIEAFRKIHERMPEARLIIAGSSFFGGAARTAYERELVELAEPVSDAIVFTGYLAHEKLKYLYSAVDMVVVPSIWQDPCPLVVLEAMASGTCLAASAVGGIPEIVENDINGVLLQPGDGNALAKAVCKLFEEPTIMHQMEKEAREKILRDYTWQKLLSGLDAITSFSSKTEISNGSK